MSMLVPASWVVLLVIHLAPALVVLRPSLTTTLYGIAPSGDLGVLLRHRGALFGALILGCSWALIDPHARPVVAAMTGLSMTSFVWLYVRAGRPEGSLRRIFVADLIGVPPLVVVLIDAWCGAEGRCVSWLSG